MPKISLEEFLAAERPHSEYRLLYDNATRNIEFTKRQSWWLTNQALIAIGALVFVESQFDQYDQVIWDWSFITIRVSSVVTLVVIALMCLIVVAAEKLIGDLYLSAEGERKRLEYLRLYRFTQEFRTLWEQKKKHKLGSTQEKHEEFRHKWIMRWQRLIIFGGYVVGLALVVVSG